MLVLLATPPPAPDWTWFCRPQAEDVVEEWFSGGGAGVEESREDEAGLSELVMGGRAEIEKSRAGSIYREGAGVWKVAIEDVVRNRGDLTRLRTK